MSVFLRPCNVRPALAQVFSAAKTDCANKLAAFPNRQHKHIHCGSFEELLHDPSLVYGILSRHGKIRERAGFATKYFVHIFLTDYCQTNRNIFEVVLPNSRTYIGNIIKFRSCLINEDTCSVR